MLCQSQAQWCRTEIGFWPHAPNPLILNVISKYKRISQTVVAGISVYVPGVFTVYEQWG